MFILLYKQLQEHIKLQSVKLLNQFQKPGTSQEQNFDWFTKLKSQGQNLD